MSERDPRGNVGLAALCALSVVAFLAVGTGAVLGATAPSEGAVTYSHESSSDGVTYYQVDLVSGEPLETVGPANGSFYSDRGRLVQYLHGSSADTVTRRGRPYTLNRSVDRCVESEDVRAYFIGTAMVRFTVKEDCNLALTFASYEKPESGFSRNVTQTLYDSRTRTFGPGNHTMIVELPGDDRYAGSE